MITKQDLMESIAECQGVRNPNVNTCMKLAAFYTILDHMEDDEESDQDNSGRSAKSVRFQTPEEVISYHSSSEFGQAIDGLNPSDIWSVMDELMSMVQMLEPKLYNAVMRKIHEVQ